MGCGECVGVQVSCCRGLCEEAGLRGQTRKGRQEVRGQRSERSVKEAQHPEDVYVAGRSQWPTGFWKKTRQHLLTLKTLIASSAWGNRFIAQVEIRAPGCPSWICHSSDNAEICKPHRRDCAPAILEEASQRRKESNTCGRQRSGCGSEARHLLPAHGSL